MSLQLREPVQKKAAPPAIDGAATTADVRGRTRSSVPAGYDQGAATLRPDSGSTYDRQRAALSPGSPLRSLQLKESGKAASDDNPEQAPGAGPGAGARALYERARAAYESGDYNTAMVLCEQVRQLPDSTPPHRTECLVNLGTCNWKLGRYHTAIDYFTVALLQPNILPEDVAKCRKRRARCQKLVGQKQGDPNSQGVYADDPDQREGQDTSKADQLYEQGREAFEKGQYVKAIKILEQVRHMPEVPTKHKAVILQNIGKANLELGRPEAAVFYLELALAHPALLSEHRATSEVDLAKARELAGLPPLPDEAKKKTRDGTTEEAESNRSPEEASHRLFDRAKAEFDAGNYGTAVVLLEQVRLSPHTSEKGKTYCLMNLGTCNYKLGRHYTAIDYCNVALLRAEITEEDAAAIRERRARSQRKLGLPEGDPNYAGLHTDDPSHEPQDTKEADALWERAKAAFQNGQYAKAVKLLENVRHRPETAPSTKAVILQNLGMCNLELGRPEAAVFYLELALAHPALLAEHRARSEECLVRARAAAGMPVATPAPTVAPAHDAVPGPPKGKDGKAVAPPS